MPQALVRVSGTASGWKLLDISALGTEDLRYNQTRRRDLALKLVPGILTPPEDSTEVDVCKNIISVLRIRVIY